MNSHEMPIRKGGSAEMFNQITSVKLSLIVVDRIKTLIREGTFTSGDQLPSENDLCASYGVERAAVRDALQILKTMGLIEFRLGSKGASYVTASDPNRIVAGLNNMTSATTLSAAEVREARLIFELGLIDLICERITDEDLSLLVDICERSKTAMEDDNYGLDLSLQFHRALARCAHNRALDLIVDTFQASLSIFERPVKEDGSGRWHPGVQEHFDLVDAIRSRNPTLAKAIMELHRSRIPKNLRLIA